MIRDILSARRRGHVKTETVTINPTGGRALAPMVVEAVVKLPTRSKPELHVEYT